jgi:hypothetical protein
VKDPPVSTTHTKYQDSDNEAPEIQLAAVAEWMIRIRRPAATIKTIQEQDLIAAVDK